MGNEKNKSEKQMVTVETRELKERLNLLFQARHGSGMSANNADGMFEALWDLKEKALMERRSSIEVPGNWLDQLEQEQSHIRH